MILTLLLAAVVSTNVKEIPEVVGGLIDRGNRKVLLYPALVEEHDGKLRLVRESHFSSVAVSRIRTQMEEVARGRVEFVDAPSTNNAIRDFYISELVKKESVKEVLDTTGADVLIFGFAKSIQGASQQIELVQLTRSQASYTLTQQRATIKKAIGLSDLAYHGKNFEVRRLNADGHITAVGFNATKRQQASLNGLDESYEQLHAALLSQTQDDLLADPEFPFDVSIQVDGNDRAISHNRGQYVIELNEGEQPKILMKNRAASNVLVGVYIDGNNIIGSVPKSPLDATTRDHLVLAPKHPYHIRGWYKMIDGQQHILPFVVQDVPDGRNRKAFDPAGMITFVFYSSGTGDLTIPTPIVSRRLRMGAGEPEPINVRRLPGRKGLMLAAITIYYQSKRQTQKIVKHGILASSF